MATLNITIGNTSASRTIDNTKLQALVTVLFEQFVAPGWNSSEPLPTSAADKLQAVLDWNAKQLRDLAREAKRQQLAAQRANEDTAAVAAIDI